jgi:hypothetical protein
MNRSLLSLCVLGLAAAGALAADAPAPAYRTDGGDPKLPWFELKQGEFPPPNSAHEIGGELIELDHVNRMGMLRADRTDAQRRGDWDQPLWFEMLPYGTVRYHGAPAEMRDLPIGTHLWGQFYRAEKPAKETRPGIETEFTRVLLLEDDFSHSLRQQRYWKIEQIDVENAKLTVSREGDAKPTAFTITPATRVWNGRGVGTLDDLQVGQSILLNLTFATQKGPGRLLDLWLDPESRVVASGLQMETHRLYMHDHGLAGFVRDVDNENSLITVALFAGFDPGLLDDFIVDETGGATPATAAAANAINVSLAVAEETLRTYDQINDRKAGPLLEIQKVPPEPGFCGVRLKIKPSLMLEGFRPNRVVRIWSPKWKVDDLAREEKIP